MEKLKLDFFLKLLQKNQFQVIKDLEMISKTIKLLEKDIGDLQEYELGTNLFKDDTESRNYKGKG